MLSKGIEITAHAWHRQRITLVIPQSMVNEAVNLLHSQFADINVTANKQEERYG
jgi:aspartokinase